MSKKHHILEQFPEEEFMFCDGMDNAIIGITTNMIVVYSADKIIDLLKHDMLEHEAIEYFNFNIEGAYMGEKTPIYVYDSIFY